MDNFKFDDRNFLITERVDVYKVAVEAYDRRNNAETTFFMLLNCVSDNELKARVKDILWHYGYEVLKIGDPQKWKLDLNTFEIVE